MLSGDSAVSGPSPWSSGSPRLPASAPPRSSHCVAPMVSEPLMCTLTICAVIVPKGATSSVMLPSTTLLASKDARARRVEPDADVGRHRRRIRRQRVGHLPAEQRHGRRPGEVAAARLHLGWDLVGDVEGARVKKR